MVLDWVKLKEIKPALAGYIRASQSLLKESDITDEKAIHDVRVLMKKSRAVLKLCASQLDSESYDRDIRALREVGRILSLRRETSVYRKLLKELKKGYPEIFSQLEDNEKVINLLKKSDSAAEQTDELRNHQVQLGILLNKTGYRIRFQSMNKFDPQILIKELEQSYLKVVDNYLICRNKPKASDLHEFRKKAKDFLYQLYFFRPVNPGGVKAVEKRLDSLTQNLGRFNDLNQLVLVLGYKYPDSNNIAALDELIIKIREMQDRYLSKVWSSAYKIFCPGQKLENVLGFKLLVI